MITVLVQHQSGARGGPWGCVGDTVQYGVGRCGWLAWNTAGGILLRSCHERAIGTGFGFDEVTLVCGLSLRTSAWALKAFLDVGEIGAATSIVTFKCRPRVGEMHAEYFGGGCSRSGARIFGTNLQSAVQQTGVKG